MKMIINCPICNHILVTEYIYCSKQQSVCKKYCMNYYHVFRTSSYADNHYEVKYLILKLDNIYWKFDFELKEILVNFKKKLAFFHPDFSNLNKLKNKLKICIAFS
jgi:hypothetical protein